MAIIVICLALAVNIIAVGAVWVLADRRHCKFCGKIIRDGENGNPDYDWVSHKWKYSHSDCASKEIRG